jgi:hypothetical protein
VIAAMTREHGIVVPSFCKETGSTTLFFQQHQQHSNNLIPIFVGGKPQQPSSLLFAVEASSSSSSSSSSGDGTTGGSADDTTSSSTAAEYPGLDWDSFETKNKSRQKFGLQPMTPEQFLELQSQVKEMDVVQRQRAATNAAQKELADSNRRNNNNNNVMNPLQRLFGNVLENTCESNDDCQRPEICCDLGFKKMCCASGSFVGHSDPAWQRQYATVPVPVGVSDDFPQDSYGRRY